MKLLTSIFVVASIFAITKALSNSNLDQVSQNINSNFDMATVDYFYIYLNQYQNTFENLDQTIASQYSSASLTPAQQQGVQFVLVTRNSYKDLFISLNDTVNNYRAWTKGNLTSYKSTFQSLLVDFDNSFQNAMTIMAGRTGCGFYDSESAKMEIMSPVYTVFSLNSMSFSNTFNSFSNLMGQTLIYGVQSVFSTFLNDYDPVAYMKASEASVIYPNAKLLKAEIENVGDTAISMINKVMYGQVTNIKAAINRAPDVAKSFKCTGN